MLRRFRMPLFMDPDMLENSRLRQSWSQHFHDYVFKYYGLL